MTWLLTIEARDAADQPATLRFSDGSYDDPGRQLYLPRIAQPGLYQAGLYAGGIVGVQRSGIGETVLINADGGLDYLADYAVDGRAVVLSRDQGEGATEVLRGTAAGLSFEGREVVLRLREPQALLERPHPHEVYAGDNAPPDGLEGTGDDIAGQPKPRVYGDVRNADPVSVNASKLIYQASSLGDCSVSAVYDQGAALTPGAPYADLTELQSTAPAAGEFRAYQGYVRLGSSPVGQITVDAASSATSIGAVMGMLCHEIGQPEDTSALDSAGAAGLFVTDTASTAALLDRLAESAGAWWRITSAGQLEAEAFVAPSGGGVSLGDHQVGRLDRTALGAGENGLPIWRVIVQADRIETTQTDLAGSVSQSRRARLAREYREAIAERPAVQARHPLAGELMVVSALRDLADAQALAERLADLLSVRRDRLTLQATLTALQNLGIGDAVTLTTPRLGYAAGRSLTVIGRQLNAQTGQKTLELWG